MRQIDLNYSLVSKLSISLLAVALLFLFGIRGSFAETSQKTTGNNTKLEQAVFAAGCFWKVQYVFSKVAGVVKTRVGYTGGKSGNPSYEQVCTDKTGHAEAVLVEYDPAKTSYHKLLEIFWDNHDPTTVNRQGPDHGTQYRSVVF